MTIKVRITTNYGQRAVYPACENSKLLARIAGTKTLTDATLACIKQMGITIEVEQTTL